MKMFSDCSDDCSVCRLGDGGCIAGHGDDDFCLATEEQLVERLDNNKYSDRRSYMITVLKDKFGIDYESVGE